MHCHVLLSQIQLFSSRIIARRADGCPDTNSATVNVGFRIECALKH